MKSIFSRVIILFSITLFYSCSSELPKELESYAEYIPEEIDYNFHVKPILSDRCYKCHGPDKNQLKANFRLDQASLVFKSTESNDSKFSKTIVKGKPLKSELIERILSYDPDIQMPPEESHLNLSNREKAILSRWIAQGAEYKEHWSFIPPKMPEVPLSGSEWSNNEVDHFIFQKIEEKGLVPAPQEEREKLLRRIHFDITGLPPSVQELADFINSDDIDIYEKTIDKLLESPHYGEHMAVGWLDVARYADTHGYQDDGLRTAWPYRDWVIEAFNENMPYDQFLTEQLAGDLLPNPSKEELVATCFLRNHPQTQEGGIVDEEYRVEYVADRTNTFGKAMLGLTMECARCHDHKYDPLSQKDYFSLYAYFNNNNESGIVPYVGEASPTVLLPTKNEEAQLDSLRSLMAPLQSKLVSEEYVSEFKNWMSDDPKIVVNEKGLLADFSFDKIIKVQKSKLNLDGKKSPGWGGIGNKGTTPSLINEVKQKPDAAILGDIDRVPLMVEGMKGKALKFIGDCGFRFNRDLDLDRHEQISVSIWLKIDDSEASGPLFNNTNGNFEGYRGWLAKLNPDQTLSVQFNHVWPDNSIDFQTKESLPDKQWIHLAVTYDGSSKAEGINIYIDGKKPAMILHQDNLIKSMLNGKDGKNWSSMPFMIGKELTQSLIGVTLDEMKVFNRELSSLEVQKLYDPNTVLNPSEERWLAHYLKSGADQKYNSILQELTEVREAENELMTNMTEVMVMNERKSLRSTFLLDRGVYDAPSEKVNPDIPDQIKTTEDYNSDRLGLAKWLVSEDNPLTARVAVNRIWTVVFGKGIVTTPDDFGNQGNLPSHPELLDWLALDFMNNGWNVKRLIKKMLMSKTYQQKAYNTSDINDQDADNQWYTRYPKHRLTAEEIRDRALAACNILVDHVGGPSVYPYQPKGLWKELATRNETEYKQGTGDDLYRRSLYTIWKRSSPPPAMMSFDAPDRFICTVNRQNTSTPLQSLVLMNDPQYLEAAKVLAYETSMIIEDPSEQVAHIFKSLINRAPSEEEMDILLALKENEYKDLSDRPLRSEELLSVGEKKINVKNGSELASLMIVASTVMNYDEFVLKT